MTDAIFTETEATQELRRLIRSDLRASKALDAEARYLVDLYYSIQEERIRAAHQSRMSVAEGEPVTLTDRVFTIQQTLEDEIRHALGEYAENTVPGEWALSILGVGPVIAAGMLAHIDIQQASSPSSVWRFAGLDPTQKWEKGQKRPWNARLKVLCWKLGESFVKVSGNKAVAEPRGLYARIYLEAKEMYVARNEAGAYAEQAEQALATKNYGKATLAYAAYQSGKLPDGRIHLRAQRKAVKTFLAHLWNVMYEDANGTPAPSVWAVAHGGHVDVIPVPNWLL